METNVKYTMDRETCTNKEGKVGERKGRKGERRDGGRNRRVTIKTRKA